jgi:hypothetical protein
MIFYLDGLAYQLGEANMSKAKPVVLVIEGRLKRSLFGNPSFKGEIFVEGEQIPVPWDQREVSIRFDGDGYAPLSYFTVMDGSPACYTYGNLFVNRDFSAFTISKFARDTPDSSHAGWSSEDGFMVTAPAATRAEAIELSNELMRSIMRNAREPLK